MESAKSLQINLSNVEKQYTIHSTVIPMIVYFLSYLESNPDVAAQIIEYAKPNSLSGGDSACGPIIKIASTIFFVWIVVFIMLTLAKAVFAIGFQIINGVILTESIVVGDVQVQTATGTSLITYLSNLLQPLYSLLYPQTLRNWSTLTVESAGILYAYINKAIYNIIGIPISPIDINFFKDMDNTETTLFLPFTTNFNKQVSIPNTNERSALQTFFSKTINLFSTAIGSGNRQTFQYVFDIWNVFFQSQKGPKYTTPSPSSSECPNQLKALIFGTKYCGNTSVETALVPEIIPDITPDIGYLAGFVKYIKETPPGQYFGWYLNEITTYRQGLDKQVEKILDPNRIPQVGEELIQSDSKARLAYYYYSQLSNVANSVIESTLSGGKKELQGGSLLDIIRQKFYENFTDDFSITSLSTVYFMISNFLESKTLFSFFSWGYVISFTGYDLLQKLLYGKPTSFIRSLFLPPFSIMLMIMKKVFYGLLTLFKTTGYKLFHLFDSIAEMICTFIRKQYSIDTNNPQDVPNEQKPDKLVNAILRKAVKVDTKKVKKEFNNNVKNEKPLSARENIHEAINDMFVVLAEDTKVDYEDKKEKEAIVAHITNVKSPKVNEVVNDILSVNIKQLANQATIEEQKLPLNENTVKTIIASNIPDVKPIKVVKRKSPKRSLKKKSSKKRSSNKRSSKKSSSKKRSSKKSSKKRSSKKKSSKKRSSKIRAQR